MRKAFFNLVLVFLLAALSVCVLCACNKEGDEGNGDNTVEVDQRRVATDGFEDALIALGSEGWALNLTADQAAALPNQAAYYVYRATASRLGDRLYADGNFQNSKIEYYTSLLRDQKTVDYARDAVSRQKGIDLLRLLDGYDLTSEDFSSLIFILLEVSLYDASGVFDEAVAQIETALSASAYSKYVFLGTEKARMEQLSLLEESVLPGRVSKSELSAIINKIKEIDSTFAGALSGYNEVTLTDVNVVLAGIKGAVTKLLTDTLADTVFDVARGKLNSAEAAYDDYVEELEKTSPSAGDIYNSANHLKQMIGSTITISADTESWYSPLKLEAEYYIENEKLRVPVYKAVAMAYDAEQLKISKSEYEAVADDAEFKSNAEKLLTDRANTAKLLEFVYKSGKLVNGTLKGNDVDGEDLFDLTNKTSAETVAIIRSFALACKDINDEYTDSQLADIGGALSVCSEPLRLLAQNDGLVFSFDSLLEYDSKKYVDYSTLIGVVVENFERLPILLDLAYTVGYYGADALSVEVLNAVDENELDSAFIAIVAAKQVLSVTVGGVGNDGISKSDAISQFYAYRDRILTSQNKTELLAEALDFWSLIVTVVNDLLGTNNEQYFWRFSNQTYSYISDAGTLTTNLSVLKKQYAAQLNSGSPTVSTELKNAVTKLNEVTGNSVSTEITAAGYNRLVTDGEALLKTRNEQWFNALLCEGGEISQKLDKLYAADTVTEMQRLVALFPTLQTMKDATSTQIVDLSNDAKAVGLG